MSLKLSIHNKQLITVDNFGSSSDPNLNGHLHYPNDIDNSLNETVSHKIRKYRSDYNNNPPTVVSFIPPVTSTSGDYIVNSYDFYSYRLIGKLTVFWQIQKFSLCNTTVDSSTTDTYLYCWDTSIISDSCNLSVPTDTIQVPVRLKESNTWY